MVSGGCGEDDRASQEEEPAASPPGDGVGAVTRGEFTVWDVNPDGDGWRLKGW